MSAATKPGDADFAALYEEHHRRVLAYAIRRSTTIADAEDAAAETFLIAWRKSGSIPADPLPWLYGVARRVLANQRRGTLRRLRVRMRWRPDQPDAVRLGEESGPAIAALSRLPPDDQELLRLVAWEELSHAQIAVVVGVSVNAVAIRLHRARRRFEREYAHLPEAGVKGSASDRTSGWVKGKLTRSIREETK